MSLQTDLKAYLGAHAGLSALIGARLYPVTLPQEPTLPAATYLVVDDPATYHHSGSGRRQARIQLDIYAATYLAGQAIADQMEAAVNAWRSATPLYTGFQLARRDVPEPQELERCRVMVEVSIDH